MITSEECQLKRASIIVLRHGSAKLTDSGNKLLWCYFFLGRSDPFEPVRDEPVEFLDTIKMLRSSSFREADVNDAGKMSRI